MKIKKNGKLIKMQKSAANEMQLTAEILQRCRKNAVFF
jgi:hypothetical protein